MKQYELAGGGSMPAIGLGTWKSTKGEVGPVVREAIRQGYRHFDLAAAYMNEAEIGTALNEAMDAGEVTRDELFITSKLWNDSHKEADVRPALERTLAAVQLDRLDLYLMHWPVALKPGVWFPESPSDLLSLEEVPLLETWRALEACQQDGLTSHIGVSNFSARKIEDLADEAEVPISVNQVELHPYLAQDDLITRCAARGVHCTGYSPLGSPDRPDGLKKSGEPDLLAHPVLGDIGEQLNASHAQVLLAWAVNRGTSVIPKSVNAARMAENLAAANLQLSEGQMDAIAELDAGYRFIDGTFWAPEGSPYTLENLWD